MVTVRKRKCLCCKQLFKPDPRQKNRQRYCANPACRKASKVASQKKWLNKPENCAYFSGRANVERVKDWRRQHPNYWRNNKQSLTAAPLQETSLAQVVDNTKETDILTNQPLQDLISLQAPVLIGIIAHLTGETLQDQIVNSTRRLLTLGADILTNTTKQDADASSGEFYDCEPHKPPTTPSHTPSI